MTLTDRRRPRGLIHAAVGATLLAGSVGSAVSAHDFFLKPAAFNVGTDSVLSMDATVSGAFPDLLNPVTPDRIREMRVSGGGPQATLEAAGVGSKSLKLRFRGHEPGWAVLSLRIVPRDVEYPEDRIGGIMEEYEVAPAAAQAVADLPKPRVLKVVSSRFAKSLVCIARCEGLGEAARAVGHDLEFVAAGTGRGAYRLLSEGRPLADYPVAAVGSDGVRRRLRTDAGGTVALPDETEGPVMLFASVMQQPPSPEGRFGLKLASLTVQGR